MLTLNEGRGDYPGDTGWPGSRRPGWRTGRSLNEGRGAYPGDTCTRLLPSISVLHFAQRRPGCLLTPATTKAGVLTPATLFHDFPPSRLRRRSTKAGVLTPATLPVLTQLARVVAQRRPGCLPRRRHRCPIPPNGCAQRRPGCLPRRHRLVAGERQGRLSLNEGRGAYPGDTVSEPFPRSTKAGVLRDTRLDTLITDRSTKAGVLTPATPYGPGSVWRPVHAQRRPGCLPRRH